jgi:hypothetical protein
MSFVNYNTSPYQIIDTTNPRIYDNYDTFATFGDLPNSTNAILDRFYYVVNTDTYYRWNGTNYLIAINPASGTITGGANVGIQTGQVFRDEISNILNFKTIGSVDNKLTVNNNANDLTLSVNEANLIHQNLSGAGVYTHSDIDGHINGLLYKHDLNEIVASAGTNTYAIGTDGQTQINQLDAQCVSLETNKIDTITSSNSNLISITGTLDTRTINPLIGTHESIILTFANPPSIGAHIGFNASAPSSVS